ncbi:MAG: hypothetical protein H0W64_04775 [Gammaproteobacteria bacterium]|nr:hypothetical protein [Gammaproteobacteria bacterium]
MNTKSKILLTGGRAPVTLDLARRFKHYGHEVYVAETINYHLCRYSNSVKKSFLVPSPAHYKSAYINELSSLIQKYNIDLLIPTCEEIFYISSELEALSRLTKVMVDKINNLDLLHNKFSFNKLIENTEISTPETMLVKSMVEYNELINAKQITYPHVLKPAYSRFASQTKFIFASENIKLDISEKRPWVAQAYISGKLICTYSICHEGKILANVFYENNYSAGENGAGISFKRIENAVLFNWITQFVKSLNYTGQIAFDIIEANDRSLWPIECNPRSTSGIHLFSDSLNIPNVFLLNSPIGRSADTKRQPMLSLAMLVYILPNLRSFKKFSAWIKCFLVGKDVIFRWGDPLPFVMQLFAVINFFKISRKQNISLIEATTHDIEWNGD